MSESLKKVLLWTGLIGSILGGITYLITIYIIVQGFNTSKDVATEILFLVISSIFGVVIIGLVRIQGATLAASEPASREVTSRYNKALNKTKSLKKLRTINHYLVKSTIFDIFTKGLLIGFSSYAIFVWAYNGNGNYSLFLLALGQLLMFYGFGVLGLSKAYDKYIYEHLPILEERIIKLIDQAGSVQPAKGVIDDEVQEHRLLVTTSTSSEE